MTHKIFLAFILGWFLSSCHESKNTVPQPQPESSNVPVWNDNSLSIKAAQHLDSTNWGKGLLKQDIETYQQYREFFQRYPINKSPFPVAEYDYAVSSIPFSIESNNWFYKGVRVGEFENPESERIIDRLVLTNDKSAEEATLVDSRNFPYLTAQGYFKTSNNRFDWVFTSSPDGYSTLLVNMKLFDLRFGETIIIYPQTDESFFYDQIKDSPNNYENFDEFKRIIIQ